MKGSVNMNRIMYISINSYARMDGIALKYDLYEVLVGGSGDRSPTEVIATFRFNFACNVHLFF